MRDTILNAASSISKKLNGAAEPEVWNDNGTYQIDFYIEEGNGSTPFEPSMTISELSNGLKEFVQELSAKREEQQQEH